MTSKELAAIAHELRYWQWFVQTARFLTGWVQKNPTPELNPFVQGYIKSVNPTSMLDVGSGVVSILNGLIPGAKLTAADPLGELYGLIFDYKRNGISPPEPYPAEELPYVDAFDIVHMSNALDHCQNPELVVQKLYLAAKPGGSVIVQGFVEEGKAEGYSGFHQWDLDLINGVIVANGKPITGQGKITNKIMTPQKREWFIWIAQK